MRHFHSVTRTPQAAISSSTIDLQTMLAIVELYDQVTGMIATLEAKKVVTS